MNPTLTFAELRLKVFLKFVFLLSFLATFFHLFPKSAPACLINIVNNGYAILSNNSILQAGLLLLFLLLAIGDVRRFSPVIRVLKLFLLIAVVWSAISWIKHPGEYASFSFALLLAYLLALVSISMLFKYAEKARYGLKYLSIQQFQTLEALAEVCVSGDSSTEQLQILPIEVATNVDTYLLSFRAKSKWVMKMVLTCIEYYPLIALRPPLSLMLPDSRLVFLRKRFEIDFSYKTLPRWYIQMIQAAIRMSKQLCYMGYYSDERVYKSIGYLPFEERKDKDARMAEFPKDHSQAKSLIVMNELNLRQTLLL